MDKNLKIENGWDKKCEKRDIQRPKSSKNWT